MNCLCCGKPLRAETAHGWHKACVKRFFGTDEIPEIEIDEKALELLAVESTGKGYTVPGVQKKLSLHLFSRGGKPRLTIVNYPTGYILKPQTDRFEALPEAEQLVMCMADRVGIKTVPHALISSGSSYAYITKRIDRVFHNSDAEKLAMEDFCQLDLRLTQDKYRGSYERCGKIIEKYSSRKNFDIAELFTRLVFSFIVGNSDMHLKNFSLIETAAGSEEYVLSAAYDLLPVNVILPEDKEQLALAMNGKKTNIRKKDFLLFADNVGISKETAERMTAQLLSKKDVLTDMCGDSLLPAYMKEAFVSLIEERCAILGNKIEGME